MLQVINTAGRLARSNVCRSLLPFSTSSARPSDDPMNRKEAPILDNESVLALPGQVRQKEVQAASINVPVQQP